MVVARDAGQAGSQREVAAAWTAAIEAAGLPLVGGDLGRGRARIAFGAPLPVGMAAERELIDIVLTESWPVWRVREAVTPYVPPGWRLIDLYDVWLGGPPLPGRVAAADYRIELDPAPDAAALAAAAAELVAARRLARQRLKGEKTVDYDLPPRLMSVAVEAGPPLSVRTRTRPGRCSGRRCPASTPSSAPAVPKRCSPLSPKDSGPRSKPDRSSASGCCSTRTSADGRPVALD